MALTFDFAVRCHAGLVRRRNEDSGLAAPNLVAVADGMGGHAGGEVASRLAIETALEFVAPGVPGALAELVARANARIATAPAADGSLHNLGSTLTAVQVLAGEVTVVHVGDSRAYRLRAGELTRLTQDHTMVQAMVDAGALTADEARSHPRRSVLMKALTGSDVEPDVLTIDGRAGDRLLLCSDGLSDVVSDAEIGAALQDADGERCAATLLELALQAGGPDNITVIVADLVDTPAVEAAAPTAARPVVVGAAADAVPDAPPDTAPPPVRSVLLFPPPPRA